MYLGYDKNGNYTVQSHGQERLIGATESPSSAQLLSNRQQTLVKPEKKVGGILSKNQFFALSLLGPIIWWFFIREKPRKYDPFKSNRQYKDYITGKRKELPGMLNEAQTPFRGRIELSEFQKNREKRRLEEIAELKRRRNEFLYGKGDREV